MANRSAKRYEALYDYTANTPGDLSFTKGDIITVLQTNGNWWKGQLETTGEVGLFPSNYVVPHEAASQNHLVDTPIQLDLYNYASLGADFVPPEDKSTKGADGYGVYEDHHTNGTTSLPPPASTTTDTLTELDLAFAELLSSQNEIQESIPPQKSPQVAATTTSPAVAPTIPVLPSLTARPAKQPTPLSTTSLGNPGRGSQYNPGQSSTTSPRGNTAFGSVSAGSSQPRVTLVAKRSDGSDTGPAAAPPDRRVQSMMVSRSVVNQPSPNLAAKVEPPTRVVRKNTVAYREGAREEDLLKEVEAAMCKIDPDLVKGIKTEEANTSVKKPELVSLQQPPQPSQARLAVQEDLFKKPTPVTSTINEDKSPRRDLLSPTPVVGAGGKSDSDIRKREEECKRREDDVLNRELELKRKDTEVKSKEVDVRNLELEVKTRDLEVRGKEQDLKKNEEAVRVREEEIRRKEEELKRREDSLAAREAQLKEQQDAVNLKAQKVAMCIQKLKANNIQVTI
eukprot:TRINITY_DN1025_c0_g1_i1.p1 TRINITY_DN1025_c0_g1~~TRINITY_DN1025_c0_g1_i1.p1  ORF type:complete len:509 (-),score=176.12 TRINITY_DN1025_c0_g1_i1:201-1727(-)